MRQIVKPGSTFAPFGSARAERRALPTEPVGTRPASAAASPRPVVSPLEIGHRQNQGKAVILSWIWAGREQRQTI